ncbi:hypothetical protein KAR91_61480 [Candidatus Pacearchaeota archaeon]|nr:hypothetical protein [Candidatus Pacearchaeota archaeon]
MDNEMTNGQDKTAAEEVPVCSNCFRPYDDALEYYCPHCESNEAANPLTPYIPYVNIRFNVGVAGKMWRRFQHRQNATIARRLLDLLILLLYCPLLILATPFVVYAKWKNHKQRDAKRVLYCIGIAVALAICFFLFVKSGSGPDK